MLNLRRLAIVASLLAAGLAASGCDKHTTAPVANVPPLSSVTIAPLSDTVLVDGAVQFTAVAYDTGGHVVNGVPFVWSSSDLSVATVGGTGRAVGVGEGTAKITVRATDNRDTVRSATATAFVYPGRGWIAQTSHTNVDLQGISFFPSGRTGWAVGKSGTVLKSSDAGATWTQKTSGTAFNLNGVWGTSGAVWAVGDVGTLITSTDLGETWSTVSGLGASAYSLKAITFADAMHGWIVGSLGFGLRTIDGGATWSRMTISTSDPLNAVSFSGTLDGWIVTNTGLIFGTHDGGVSWYAAGAVAGGTPLNGVARQSLTLALAVGNLSVVARHAADADSSDWGLVPFGDGTRTFSGVAFPTSTLAFAAGTRLGSGMIMRSDDGGQTWGDQAANSTFGLSAIWFVDSIRGWAVGKSGQIRHTATGGLP